MLKTFITTFILWLTPISNFKIVNNALETKQIFKVDKLDEADLSIDIYQPGDSSMSKWYSIKREVDSNGIFSIILKIDSEQVFKIIDEAAQSAGLLTGKTPYEIWRKNNKVVIDYSEYNHSTEMRVFDKVVQKWVPKKVIIANPSRSSYWTSQNSEFKITPRNNVEKMIIQPSGNLLELTFANKDYMLKLSGHLYSSQTRNEVTFLDIFKEDGVDKDDATLNKALNDFYAKITQISNSNNFVPNSDYYNVIIANQNSLKFQYRQGANIVIKNENENRELPFPPYWLLLLPSLLVALPYWYFAIKRIFRR